MMANEHIMIGNNFYEKLKICKHLGILLANQILSDEQSKLQT